MKLSTITIGMLIFLALVISMSSAYFDISEAYQMTNITNESVILPLFNQSVSITRKMDKMKNITVDISSRLPGDPRVVLDIGTLFLQIPGILLEIPNVMNSMMQSITRLSPIAIPPWFVTLVQTVFIAIFIFKGLAFLRREP